MTSTALENHRPDVLPIPVAEHLMNPDALRDELSNLLAIQTNSLAQHLEQARPFLSPGTYRIWADVQEIQEASLQQTRRLTALFQRLRLSPRTRPYQQNVACYHDINLATLVPLLLADKRAEVAAIERAIKHVADQPDVVAELDAMLQGVRSQIDHLESCRTRLDDTSRAG